MRLLAKPALGQLPAVGSRSSLLTGFTLELLEGKLCVWPVAGTK